MKSVMKYAMCAIVMSCAMSAAAQSLGDVARQQKAQPKPAKAKKVYTNEDIPSVAQPTTTTSAKSAEIAEKSDDKDKGATTDDKKTRDKEYKAKVTDAKAKVADLAREIDLMDREYKLRAAVFYSDAGNRLRDDKKWADEERKYKQDSTRKRADLQAAQEKLDDLREEARKAGVTSLD